MSGVLCRLYFDCVKGFVKSECGGGGCLFALNWTFILRHVAEAGVREWLCPKLQESSWEKLSREGPCLCTGRILELAIVQQKSVYLNVICLKKQEQALVCEGVSF